MSDTPRVDSYVYKFPGCQREPSLIDFARKLEREIAEARAEVERLALEIENQQYTITCASEENQQLKESLAEARAEIERRKADYAEMNEERLQWLGVIMKQEKLIEQMREAIKFSLGGEG